MIKIQLDDKKLAVKLGQIARQLAQPSKLYGVLGETLKKIHKKRFEAETAPDGKKWRPLSPLTSQMKGNDNILRRRGYLSDKTAYNYDSKGVEFGSDAKYARLHQFGGTIKPKRAKRLKLGESGVYAKQVTVPARPWLGINDNDEAQLLKKSQQLLQRQIDNHLR
ncbi:phage morphogenesis protein [Chelonobacter oris]|uniref:phage virion morphogenesis protein n=1 Tax=Chelonobacter oris TaxID=505317 RepID=UPI00244988B4|nr:phage virion morphogenesis protein [Chelonobacter oris]MDH3001471.1 phage morphogenesis protein [Chelonobacter oris]